MITNVAQRWRDRRDTYRPIGEVINPAHYEVAAIPDDTTARGFVEQHHYSGTFVAARFRFGLYRHSCLVGVAVFSHPPNDLALAPVPGNGLERTELGRLVLLDDVPANGESFFVARAFAGLRREGIVGVISSSDPMPRTTPDGRVVFLGHLGTLYQASNGTYLGQGQRRTMRLLPDGTVFSARAISKVRARERGWRYAAAQLERHGAAALGERDDARAWLALWLPLLTRTVRHPGHHRYIWAIDKRARKHLPASLPYPKFTLTPPAPPALITLAA